MKIKHISILIIIFFALIVSAATKTITDYLYIGDGSLAAPSIALKDDKDTGLYSSSDNHIDLVAGEYSGLQVGKSTGNFANVGMGFSSSSNDSFPLIIARSQNQATYLSLNNNNTGSAARTVYLANSGSSGEYVAEFKQYATVTTDGYDRRAVVESSSSGLGVSLIGKGATADVRLYAGGRTGTEMVLSANADKSISLGQEITTPGTNPATGAHKLYFKTDDSLYSINDAGTEVKLGPTTAAALTVSTKTGTSFTAATENLYLIDTTSNDVTGNLPTAVGIAGEIIIFKVIDNTNSFIADGSGSETIDGGTTFELNGNDEFIAIRSDGTNWKIVQSHFNQLVESGSGTFTAWPFGDNVWGDLTSISLTPGEWDITVNVIFRKTGSTSTSSSEFGVSTESGNSFTDLIYSDNAGSVMFVTNSGIRGGATVIKFGEAVTGTTTYYLKGKVNDQSDIGYDGYKITARRVK